MIPIFDYLQRYTYAHIARNQLDSKFAMQKTFDYINSKDVAIKEYDKAINDSIAKAGALSNPTNAAPALTVN